MRFRYRLHELSEAGHQDVELGLRGAGCAVDPSDEELETQRAHVPPAVRRMEDVGGRGGWECGNHTPSLSLEILGGVPPNISWNDFSSNPPPFSFGMFSISATFHFFPTFSDIMERIVPCMHTFIHTYIHPCIHTCIHTYMHACMHTYMHI